MGMPSTGLKIHKIQYCDTFTRVYRYRHQSNIERWVCTLAGCTKSFCFFSGAKVSPLFKIQIFGETPWDFLSVGQSRNSSPCLHTFAHLQCPPTAHPGSGFRILGGGGGP